MGKKIISVTLDEATKNEITQRANLENRSFSNMLEHIIKYYLERERKKDELVSKYEAKGYFEVSTESELKTDLVENDVEKSQEKDNMSVPKQEQKHLEDPKMEKDSRKEKIDVVEHPEDVKEEKTLLEQMKQGKGGINLNNITHKF